MPGAALLQGWTGVHEHTLVFPSAWTRGTPCLPWKWKLLPVHPQLPLKRIHFHLCEQSPCKCTFGGNPYAGHLSTHPSYPSPSVFSWVKSSGPQSQDSARPVYDVIIILQHEPHGRGCSQAQLAPRERIIYNHDTSKVSLFFSPFPPPSPCSHPNWWIWDRPSQHLQGEAAFPVSLQNSVSSWNSTFDALLYWTHLQSDRCFWCDKERGAAASGAAELLVFLTWITNEIMLSYLLKNTATAHINNTSPSASCLCQWHFS